jgi:hypothetical protein
MSGRASRAEIIRVERAAIALIAHHTIGTVPSVAKSASHAMSDIVFRSSTECSLKNSAGKLSTPGEAPFSSVGFGIPAQLLRMQPANPRVNEPPTHEAVSELQASRRTVAGLWRNVTICDPP